MRHRKLWLPVILIMAGIGWLSSIPDLTIYDTRSLSPKMIKFIYKHTYQIGDGGFFSYVISPHPDYVAHKLGHIFGFGALGAALYYAVGKSKRLAVLLAALFAISDELHQYFVDGRSSRLGDIVLDVLAAVCFIYLLRIFQRGSLARAPVHSRED